MRRVNGAKREKTRIRHLKIRRLYDEGLTAIEISMKLGISKSPVVEVLKKYKEDLKMMKDNKADERD